MRMIGIGLSGFLVAGMAVWLSAMNITDRAGAAARMLVGVDAPALVFETGSIVRRDAGHETVVRRTGADVPVILSGLPAYHTLTFDLPMDARVMSGDLQIDMTSQVLAGVQGALRVSIRGKRRAEMLLDPGTQVRSLRIPLSALDVAGDRLVVSVSLQGSAPQAPCGRGTHVAAVVEIEATSAIYADLYTPLSSARDLARAAGGRVPVAWQEETRSEALILARDLSLAGYAPAFVPSVDAPLLSDLQPLVASQAAPVATAWPLPIAARGSNAGMRRFYRTTTWRHRFTLETGSDRQAVGALELDIALGGLGPDAAWQLAVTVNNRLVHQARINASASTFGAHVPLPADVQAAQNVMEVTLSADAPRHVPCDEGPLLLAELRQGTRLMAGLAPYASPLTDLHDALAQVGPLSLAVHGGVSAADAQRALVLLAGVLPRDVVLLPAAHQAHLLVLSGADPRLKLPKYGPIWVVRDDVGSTEPVLARVDVRDLGVRGEGMIVVIAPEGLALTEGET